ncbi:MAG: nuclear transport factor 2 family protein [Myxococcales bacterium]|nr:nuclear transport factor 2 family protein [Myxococcales bacterium]
MENAKSVGEKLVALCREGQNLRAIETLYSDDICSVEAMSGEGFPREMQGKQAALGKGKWWSENHEVHRSTVKGPYPHGDDRFAVIFDYDVTSKPMGNQRIQMEEVAIYTVSNGKIIREEFFFKGG